MSDIVSSLEEPRGGSKVFGKYKWREKLFPADSKFGRAAENLENTDGDIANFLHAAGSRPEAGPRSAPLAPRVDIAASSRQPSAASVDQYERIVDVYRRPKPRQNKGLCVRFEPAPPMVIGVGGDEAELPSRDVLRSGIDSLRSERSPSRQQSNYNASGRQPGAYGRLPDHYDETYFQPPSPRRPTGVEDKLLAEESQPASHGREAVQPASAGVHNLSSQMRDERHNLYLNLRKKEVKDISYKLSTAEEELSYGKSYNPQTAETRYRGTTQHLDVLPSEALPTTSLIPSDSPEPPNFFQDASPSSYSFPSATKDLPKLQDAQHKGNLQDFQDPSPPKDKPLSLFSVARSLGDDSLADFDSRVRRFNDLFRLNASAHVDIMTVPFERWVKTSAWWFLRGRGGLESAMRAKNSALTTANAENDGELSSILKQAYFSLAKAWWILKDVTPNLPAIRRFGRACTGSMVAAIRSSGDKHLAELVDVHLSILANMRALTMSMSRNRRLPPDHLQMQRLESQIFLETPTLPSDIATPTVNNILDPAVKGKEYIADPFFPILVGDTSRHFSFCKIFVDVVLKYYDDAKSTVPCVVSILRERTDWAVKAIIASQDGQVNLVIQSDDHGGLDWHGVQWKIPLHTMQIMISEGTCLQIRFSEKDFKTIWSICDYTQRVRKEFSARRGETVLYECELPTFRCFDCPSFPTEPVKDCRVRLFERTSVAIGDSGQQEAHTGRRLIVTTPPGIKLLSKVNYQLGKDDPIFFGTLRSKVGNTLLVRVPSSFRVSLTFHEAGDVELFRAILSGTSIMEDDHCSASLQLQDFAICPLSTDQDMAFMNAGRLIKNLTWHKLHVISRGLSTHGHDAQSKVRSEHLRVVTDCGFGTFTDRVDVGAGELQLNLSVEDLNAIKLLRAAKQDMTWAFGDGVLGEPNLSSLLNVLHSMDKSPSVVAYHFRSLSDLHSFQAMLTGFDVLYDGLASTLSISRRRMIVPMYKRWEASTPRLQIIKQDKTVQLVAFFKDFSHGTCMNFVLKVTDSFETFGRSGVSFLRIVDAKFSLPKGELDPTRDFVCLDMPEYPAEHDDIIIGFENEQDRDKFTHELPAPVNKISRMVSLRR